MKTAVMSVTSACLEYLDLRYRACIADDGAARFSVPPEDHNPATGVIKIHVLATDLDAVAELNMDASEDLLDRIHAIIAENDAENEINWHPTLPVNLIVYRPSQREGFEREKAKAAEHRESA